VLSRRQASWVQILSSYDSLIEQLEGKKNPPNAPSRWCDYRKGYERPNARLVATLAATNVDPYSNVLPAIRAAQGSHSLAADVNWRIVGTPMVGDSDPSKTCKQGGPVQGSSDLDKLCKKSQKPRPITGRYTSLRTLCAVAKWIVCGMITISQVTSELFALLNSYLETTIALH
jgi:hypothetical protein